MNDCSLRDTCVNNDCKFCDIALTLAEAEKPAATYITANLTEEQFNRLIKNESIKFKKSYHLLPNNAFIWFWIAMAVIFVFWAIYK